MSPHTGASHTDNQGEGRARVVDTHRSTMRTAAKDFILFEEIGGSVGWLNFDQIEDTLRRLTV